MLESRYQLKVQYPLGNSICENIRASKGKSIFKGLFWCEHRSCQIIRTIVSTAKSVGTVTMQNLNNTDCPSRLVYHCAWTCSSVPERLWLPAILPHLLYPPSLLCPHLSVAKRRAEQDEQANFSEQLVVMLLPSAISSSSRTTRSLCVSSSARMV